MDAEDDEDSGIELVTVNNYQQRNINQLVSLFYIINRYPNLCLIILYHNLHNVFNYIHNLIR